MQYLDVGLTLEVEPTIYLDGDVAIKVNLEVSTIVKEVRTEAIGDQGTLAYEIGTRNATTLLRLKDGETQILAGLIQDRDTHTSSHIPGLGDIPILGRLFGSNTSPTTRPRSCCPSRRASSARSRGPRAGTPSSGTARNRAFAARRWVRPTLRPNPQQGPNLPMATRRPSSCQSPRAAPRRASSLQRRHP